MERNRERGKVQGIRGKEENSKRESKREEEDNE